MKKLAYLLLASALASTSQAASIFKADNNNALNTTGSWVGSTVPGSSDVAVFNNTLTAARTAALGGSLSWAGIQLTNPGGTVTISNTGGATLTLGSSGIDMSTATQTLTIGATVNVGAAQTWTVNSGRSLAVQGVTSFANKVTFDGGTGATVANITASNASNSGAGGIEIRNATVTNSQANWTYGSGVITMNGGGAATGTQARIAVSSNTTIGNTVTLSSAKENNMFLFSGNNRSMDLTGVISGSGGVTFQANGTGSLLTIAGNNTYSGGTILIAPTSTIIVSHDNAFGTGTLSANNIVNLEAGAGDRALANALVLTTQPINFGGTNSITMSGAVSNGGAANIGTISNNIAPGKTLTFSGGIGIGNGTDASLRSFTISGSGDTTVDSVISNGANALANNFVYSGTGTLLASANNTYNGQTTVNGTGTLRLTGSSSYTGITSVTGGGVLDYTVAAANGTNSSLGAGTTIAFSSGGSGTLRYSGAGGSTNRAFNLNDSNATLEASGSGAITYSGNLGSTSGTATLTLGGTNTGNNTLSGVIGTAAGSIRSLVKSGAGTWVVSGSNAYVGSTTVSNGILSAENNKALGNTNSLAVTGGTLDVRGSTASSVTLGVGANFSLTTGGTIKLQLGTAFDQIVSSGSGTFNITGGTFDLDVTGPGFNYANTYAVLSGFGGANSVTGLGFTGYDTANYEASLSDTGVLSFAVVPEPSSVVLLVLGLTTMTILRRRRA